MSLALAVGEEEPCRQAQGERRGGAAQGAAAEGCCCHFVFLSVVLLLYYLLSSGIDWGMEMGEIGLAWDNGLFFRVGSEASRFVVVVEMSSGSRVVT